MMIVKRVCLTHVYYFAPPLKVMRSVSCEFLTDDDVVVQKISQNDASLKFSISSEIISSARAREHTHKHKKRDRFASPQKRTRRYLLNGFRERLGTLCVRIIVAFNTVLKLESLFPRQHERVVFGRLQR